MTIGERIKQRRIELGLTQTELAHRMGLTSKTTICKAETTDFNPTTDRVREFAKALECTPAYLMGWEDRKPESNNESLKGMIEFGKKFSDMFVDFSPEQINKALGIAALYEKSSPEVQAAIETLLKSVQQEP